MSMSTNVPVHYSNEPNISHSDENLNRQEKSELECGNSKSVRILEEFRHIYEERLRKIDEDSPGDGMKLKIRALTSWVNDLGEQNLMLVETVEQLEREAADRVTLLEERLKKSSHVALEYMSRLEKYDNQFLDLSEESARPTMLPIKTSNRLVQAQQTEEILKARIGNLQNDISGLLELIRRARYEGSWDTNGLSFLEVTYEDIFGSCPQQVSDNLGTMQATIHMLHQNLGKVLEDYDARDQEVKLLREQVTCLQADVALKDLEIKTFVEKMQQQENNGSDKAEVLFGKEKDVLKMPNTDIAEQAQEAVPCKVRTVRSGTEELEVSILSNKLEVINVQLQTTLEENEQLVKENECLSTNLKNKTDRIAVLAQQLADVDKKKGVSFAPSSKEDYKLQVQELQSELKQAQNGAELEKKQITRNNECLHNEVQFAKHIEECRVNVVLAQAAIEETVEELQAVADILREKEEKIHELEILIQCLQNSLMHSQEDIHILLKSSISNEEKVSDVGQHSLSYLTKVQAVSQLLESLKHEITSCDGKYSTKPSTESCHGNFPQNNSFEEIFILLAELSQQEMEVSQRYFEINSFENKLRRLHSAIKDTHKNIEEYVRDKKMFYINQVQSEKKIKKLQMELESVQEDLEQCLKTFEATEISSSDIE